MVEDASHLWAHQLLSLFYLLPALNPGGVYIWEDLHVSKPALAGRHGLGLPGSPVDFLEALVREVILYRRARRPLDVSYDDARPAIEQVMVSSLATLIDRITVVGEAAILTRNE